MAVIGSLLGLVAAVSLHALFGQLRRRWPLLTSILGWVVTLATVVYGVLLAKVYFSTRGNPLADLGPLWGFLAVMLGLLLLMCAGLAFVHRRRYQITGPRAFGVLMAEAGAAVGVGLLLNEFRYSLADIIRGRNIDTSVILDSYARVGSMLGYFNVALLLSLLLLAAFAGRRAKQ